MSMLIHWDFWKWKYKSVKEGDKYVVKADQDPERVSKDEERDGVKMIVTSPKFEMSGVVNVDGEQYLEKPQDAITLLNKRFATYMSISQKGTKMQIVLAKNTTRIVFKHGLNLMLGFTQTTFINSNVGKSTKTFVAEYPPQMKRGVNNMYIYSSACQPIHVGGVMVPLLKSLWLDVNKREYNFGEIRRIVIKNPMYVPVSARQLNSVEINIRSDSGRLFPFIEGAVTNLTLHFKKASCL
jgi:hypothetical protein